MNDKIPSTRWLRIITPVLIACIISFMDRVNISFALPGGMEADLGITSQMAGVASGIFFIGYLFLQIPGGRIAVNGSGKRFIAWSLMAWAVVSIATGFVTHEYQLLVLRFILGVSEGGMLPVVLTMVSNWFPEKELGRANAFVMMFAPLGRHADRAGLRGDYCRARLALAVYYRRPAVRGSAGGVVVYDQRPSGRGALAAGGRASLSGYHAGRRAGGKAGGRCGQQRAGQRCFPQ
ncbi:major facilitator superfamily protein [Raoultella ornithinolytica]|nr:major facilitator superfamily protein [Raoultella ornithinolytica]